MLPTDAAVAANRFGLGARPGELRQLGSAARDALLALGETVEWHEYPMEHSVCLPEIADHVLAANRPARADLGR